MKQIIEDLYKFHRHTIGSGYDSALEYIKMLIPLDVLEFKSGSKVGDWTIPPEWIIRDGWIKHNGEKICDYKDQPLCISSYSLPVNKIVSLDELKKHVVISDTKPAAYSFDRRVYDRDWMFTYPKSKFNELKDGDYEVCIDSEDRNGTMKIGVHTIKGKSEKEILLFSSLDGVFSANTNISGVACLIDLAGMLKDRFEHTIKIIFCPGTIGSVAYASTQDITNVDFVIAVDSVGNDNTLLFQKAYDKYARINYCAHLAVAGQGVSYRKGEFRLAHGSDEYYFNDPKIGIPGILISRFPFDEHYTELDTPEIIKDEKIKEVQKVILKTIEYYERDYIPKIKIKGVVMRSKYGIQSTDRLLNRELDYLFNEIDGKRYLSEIILQLGLGFDFADETLKKLGKNVIKVK